MMTTKDMYEQTMKELEELLNMTKEEIENELGHKVKIVSKENENE